MKKIITLFAVLLTFIGYSQSTLIEYNYHDESYTFYKITKRGDTIKKKQPFSYRNIPVKVVVKDLNTFRYNVAIETESYSETPVGSEANVETLLSGYATGLSSFNQLIGEVKENDIYQSIYKDGKFQGLTGITGAFGMVGADYKEELEDLEDATTDLQRQNDNLVTVSEKVDALFDYMTLVDFTNLELQKLLYNPDITHEEMKKRAESLANEVFSGNIEFNTVLNESTEKSKILHDYTLASNDYLAKSDNVESSIQRLTPRVTPEIKTELNSYSRIVTERKEAIVVNRNKMQENSVTPLVIRSKLMDVYENYDKIMHADFNYEYSTITEKDITQLTMRFGLVDNDSIGTVKTRIINIPTHGGLRINTSAGMSFTSFFNGQNSYLNNAGLIQEVEGDLFSPAISTMFHFYRQSFRPFTIGGNFGLSVPIEGQKDFIYMTGLSGIIGKSQRVIINIGAMGGKVERLSDGLKSGDALISEYSEVPMKRVFDLGFYVGVTFNINSLISPAKTETSSSNSASSSSQSSGSQSGSTITPSTGQSGRKITNGPFKD